MEKSTLRDIKNFLDSSEFFMERNKFNELLDAPLGGSSCTIEMVNTGYAGLYARTPDGEIHRIATFEGAITHEE